MDYREFDGLDDFYEEQEFGDEQEFNYEKDTEKVIVMNKYTWNEVEKQILETAKHSDNPIGHISMLKGIDVIIDNDLPNGFVEVYERWAYRLAKELREMEKEQGEYDDDTGDTGDTGEGEL